MQEPDIIIIGAGAAGLAAAIFAGEAARNSSLKTLLLEGAKKPGAKILVSGGGRCNVTNEAVAPEDFCGGSRVVIRNILRAFDEKKTIAWMKALGVSLKLEPTGKYFPTTDKARSILDALLAGVKDAGVELKCGQRVAAITRTGDGFQVQTSSGSEDEGNSFYARRLIAATGGLSLPKSGSDGRGIQMLSAMGHCVVPTTPALVSLILKAGSYPGGRFAELSGLTLVMRLSLHGKNGKRIAEITGSLLFTHFGLSGPAALDFSRHWLRARLDHPGEELDVCLGVPELQSSEAADKWLLEQGAKHPRRGVVATLGELVPEQLAKVLAERIADSSSSLSQLNREDRLRLARNLSALPLPVIGDRGYAFAETTAGGIDLAEINPRTMESRKVPGLYICGEMLDVDGRIGGFNFQWAWASGYLAGRGAATSLSAVPNSPA